MKQKFLLALLIIISIKGYCQKVDLPLKDSLIVYEGIIKLDTTYKKEIIYKSAKTWFVNTFKSVKYVIQSDDYVSGRIIGKGQIQIPVSLYIIGALGPNCDFSIQIDIKDGKYRYRVYNIISSGEFIDKPFKVIVSDTYSKYLHDQYKPHGLLGKEKMYSKFNESFKSIDYQIKQLITSLITAMKLGKVDDF